MSNRLHLNFQLNKKEERNAFLTEYLQRAEFIQRPLTEDELETCANYLLYGRDETGKNSVQQKEVQIKTKNGTWDNKREESLEALVESPNFYEASLLDSAIAPQKIPREVFSRESSLRDAPNDLKPILENLFDEIDSLDLLLNYYDLEHDKRKKPPREDLLQKFSEEEREEIYQKALSLNSFKYLKLRHLLVELRRQQYTLRDSFSSTIQRHTPPSINLVSNELNFESEIEVYPLGVFDAKNPVQNSIFQYPFDPNTIPSELLPQISSFIWTKKELRKNSTLFLDFRSIEHVYQLFLMFYKLEDSGYAGDFKNQTLNLLNTLNFYVKMCGFNDILTEILDLKKKGYKNQDVADLINKKYHKSYTANYISTLFRQKIIKQINEAAAYHLLLVENCFFPENWRKCTACGELLFINEKNFIRKKRSKDGFSNRCKRCDKKERDRKKELKEGDSEKV